MNIEKLRAGVIGVGHLGRHHARIYHQLDNVELVAVSDLSDSAAQMIAQQYHCRAERDFRSFLKDVDLVSVAVPTTAHYEVARQCIDAGVHVLVEKPITATIDEGTKLIESAREKGVVLMVGQSERFNPAVAAATSLICAPRFIEVHRLGPFPSRATDVDVVLDLMIHDVDLILHWVNSDVADIRSSGVNVLTNRIDIASTRIEFKSGCVANLTTSRISLQATRKVRVFQPNLYLSIDCLNQQVSGYRKLEGVPDSDPMSSIQPVPFTIERIEPLVSELRAFTQSVRDRTNPPIPGEQALKALDLCQKVSDCIRKNIAAFPI